ncbi:GAF and ANTAR domain-containing protein [Amycolatopsis sp. NPDC051128]|uniref:GAF and ANTAR domain-containing protein n=1 Tax=Amycolatopsis sp. NPDC051128 TaxID=3155412 RepID=UPI003422D92F
MDHIHDVSAALLELTESLRADQSRDETLARMASRVVTLLPGAYAASVTLFEGGVPATVAATEEGVRTLDKVQYSLGDGPCIEATRTETVVRTDIGQARRRWPALAEAVAEAGVETMISCPLFVRADNAAVQEAADDHHLSGALNVWSRQPGAFEPAHAALIALFTTAMSGVILTAARWGRAQAEAGQLLVALRTRDTIATAKGIVMARRNLTVDEAFCWLTEVSQHTNCKIREIARVIVADPGLVEPGGQAGGDVVRHHGRKQGSSNP